MIRSAIALTLLAACNSSSPDHIHLVDAGGSAMADANGGDGTFIVDVNMFGGAPALILYRDGTGPWTVPTTVTPQQFELHVTNDYQLVTVCTSDGGAFQTTVNGYTSDEGDQYVLCNGTSGDASAIAVTGTMNQAGAIAMSDTATSTTAPWQFHLGVPAGTHDLVATGGGRMLMRRAQTIGVAMTEAAIDLVADGTAMGSATAALTGLENGDSVSTRTYLLTANDFAAIGSTASATLQTAPASLLQPSDFQIADVTAVSSMYVRWATAPVSDSSIDIALLPRLTGVSLELDAARVSATWGTLPDADELALELISASATQQVTVTGSRAWLAAVGATTLAFPTEIPGYLPAWTVDLSGNYVGEFEVMQESNAPYTGGTAILTTAPSSTACCSVPRQIHLPRAVLRQRHHRLL